MNEKTRAEAKRELDKTGITGAAAEELLQQGAWTRFRARMLQITQCAPLSDHARELLVTDALKEDFPDFYTDAANYLALLCLLDSVGTAIGDLGSLERERDRIIPFRGLGRGCKHASDGKVWTSAIYAVLDHIIGRVARVGSDGNYGFILRPSFVNNEWTIEFGVTGYPFSRYSEQERRLLNRWIKNLALQGMKTAMKAEPRFKHPCIQFVGKPAKWSLLYNQEHARISAEAEKKAAGEMFAQETTAHAEAIHALLRFQRIRAAHDEDSEWLAFLQGFSEEMERNEEERPTGDLRSSTSFQQLRAKTAHWHENRLLLAGASSLGETKEGHSIFHVAEDSETPSHPSILVASCSSERAMDEARQWYKNLRGDCPEKLLCYPVQY